MFIPKKEGQRKVPEGTDQFRALHMVMVPWDSIHLQTQEDVRTTYMQLFSYAKHTFINTNKYMKKYKNSPGWRGSVD